MASCIALQCSLAVLVLKCHLVASRQVLLAAWERGWGSAYFSTCGTLQNGQLVAAWDAGGGLCCFNLCCFVLRGWAWLGEGGPTQVRWVGHAAGFLDTPLWGGPVRLNYLWWWSWSAAALVVEHGCGSVWVAAISSSSVSGGVWRPLRLYLSTALI